MLKGVLDQLGSLALEEKYAVEEAARAAVARELGTQRGGRARGVPALRMPLVHREGQGPRQLAALALQGARADILRQDDVTAALLQAQARGLARLRVRHAVGHLAARLRRAVRRLPQDFLVHARAPVRGDGAGPPALPHGRVRLVAGRRHLPVRVAQGQPLALGRRDVPHGPQARGRRPRARHILAQSLRRLRRQRPGRLVLSSGGSGRPSDAELAASLEGLSPANSLHRRLLPRLGAASHEASPTGEAASDLGMVNALHQRLKRFMGRFTSVPARRPSHYLALFGRVEQARRPSSRAVRVLSGQASVGHHKHTRVALFSVPQPLWGVLGAMSTVA